MFNVAIQNTRRNVSQLVTHTATNVITGGQICSDKKYIALQFVFFQRLMNYGLLRYLISTIS